ncbi:hypothetical protein H8356DRAFT_1354168 [Neocallimastix lanati (nom. inval.)]|nr:hypothetical protein H8356DRAFT_1354168 [Neocallimastix sp. JGI-2020a]
MNSFIKDESSAFHNRAFQNNDNLTKNGNITFDILAKIIFIKSYDRELQHMLISTLLDNWETRYWT